MLQLPMPKMTATLLPSPLHQPTVSPTPSQQLPRTITDASRQETVNLHGKPHHTTEHLARRFSSMPTLQLMQQAPSPPISVLTPTAYPPMHPTPSHNQQPVAPTHESIDGQESNLPSPCNMPETDRPLPLVLTVIQGKPQPLEPEQNLESTKLDLATTHRTTPSPGYHSNPSPDNTTDTAHLVQPYLSMMACLILNNK